MATRKKQGGEACAAIACSNARYKYGCARKSFFRFPKEESEMPNIGAKYKALWFDGEKCCSTEQRLHTLQRSLNSSPANSCGQTGETGWFGTLRLPFLTCQVRRNKLHQKGHFHGRDRFILMTRDKPKKRSAIHNQRNWNQLRMCQPSDDQCLLPLPSVHSCVQQEHANWRLLSSILLSIFVWFHFERKQWLIHTKACEEEQENDEELSLICENCVVCDICKTGNHEVEKKPSHVILTPGIQSNRFRLLTLFCSEFL